ncbi:hypothetical protein HBI84_024650 [Parastagonospora nodorum]|nr:hypothetical protein HBI84_024650 [Parastagonospora nodorum]
MDRFCTICSFQPKTYAELTKYTARYRKVHIYAADGLSSTVTVYNYIKKDKNADLAIADSISDAPDMCAKDDLVRRKGLLLTSTQTPNYVNIFSLDFAFSFANILSLIAFIISYCLFADKLNIQQSLLDRAIVMLIIILRSIPSTLLARFIPITKIRDPLLKKNVAKSEILLTCVDRRTRQCYLTICAILADYEEQVLLTSIKKNCYCTRCTIAPNNREDLSTDTLHLLLKGLVMKMLDFITSLKRFNNKRAFTELIAVVSSLFVLKAPFALHFIHAVCDLVILAQYKRALERMNVFKEEFRVYQRTLEEEKNFNYPKALDSIYTRANSEAHHITIVKQFYSITNKKEYILQIYRTYSTRVTRPLLFRRLRYCISVQIHSSIKCWQFSSKRHNDPKHCNEEVLYLILTIIDYTCYDKDRKHIAYIKAFSKVLLFNNNRQIDNTTRMLSVPFKFYDLSMIIRLVHLVLRDLPNSITRTTMSYYVNNYIN